MSSLGNTIHTSTDNCLKYIDEDRIDYATKVANMASLGKNIRGVERFMSLNNIPPLTFGNYPFFVKYVLPGKSIVTSKYRIDASYR